ncbi:UNVERIFIED_CONTAM: hypothetical protein Slati_2910300 [Sesamum latifolium]|uniref:DDE Tnp4 domain-containing protein n=1 Tax=Sesamum latifolium TaxID=2727402 RepID=A0AAW2VEJ1_9LAMI
MGPTSRPNRYRSRKGHITQNVLAICDFDMNFTYVYAWWEGSVADARVLDHAISQGSVFSFPPVGKYYLVDAGFVNYQCFLAPYRGTRYHLAEYRRHIRQYRTPQDMFNHAHSRLSNVIERCLFSQDDQLFNEPDDETPGDMDAFYHRGRPNVAEIEAQSMTYAAILTRAGFPQEEHWSLEMERRFMHMILPANAAVQMLDDSIAEGQMAYWS